MGRGEEPKNKTTLLTVAVVVVVVRRKVGSVQRGECGEIQPHLLLRRPSPVRVSGKLRLPYLIDLLLQLHYTENTKKKKKNGDAHE